MNEREVPDLGGIGAMKNFGCPIGSIVREIGPKGSFSAPEVRRDHYVDWTQMLRDIKEVIHAEVADAMAGTRVVTNAQLEELVKKARTLD